MTDEPEREPWRWRVKSPWLSACFDAAWVLGAGAMCGVMMKRLGWGAWGFLGLPLFLIVGKIWFYLWRRAPGWLGSNNRELTLPVKPVVDPAAAELDGGAAYRPQIHIDECELDS